MYLLVGLGNPGTQYERTRHNVGFLFLDYLFDRYNGTVSEQKNYYLAETNIGDKKFFLLKPRTYMNLSGKAVKFILDRIRYTDKDFYPLSNMIVVQDDVDIEPGKIKIKSGGSDAGHKGIRDIIGIIGKDFLRLRIGVGKPGGAKFIDTSDYVLGKFTQSEMQFLINDSFPRAERFITDYLKYGLNKARSCISSDLNN